MQRTMNGRIASKANALSLSFTWALPRTQVMTFSVKNTLSHIYLILTQIDHEKFVSTYQICFKPLWMF